MFTVIFIGIIPNTDLLEVRMRSELEFAPGKASSVVHTFTLSQRDFFGGRESALLEERVRTAMVTLMQKADTDIELLPTPPAEIAAAAVADPGVP